MKSYAMRSTLPLLLTVILVFPAAAQPPMTSDIPESANEAQQELNDETEETSAPALTTTEDAVETAPTPEQETVEEPAPAAPVALKPRKPKAPVPERSRDIWYIGFGLGSGTGTVEVNRGLKTHSEYLNIDGDPLGFAWEFEVGGTLNDHWLLGIRSAGLATGGSKGERTSTFVHSANLLSVTHFPMRGGKGLFVRAGLGLGELVTETKVKGAWFVGENGLEIGNETLSKNYTTLASTMGAGYAFWIGESFNLTTSLDFHHAYLDRNESADFDESLEADKPETNPTLGWYVALNTNFMWY